MPVTTPRLRLPKIKKGMPAYAPKAATRDQLSDLKRPFSNPGELGARLYVPQGLEGPAPLVVVLHGCTQDAAVYDHGSGWSTLADRHGFILLFPEQTRANNPMLCFNWFSAADTQRGGGEAASIRAMIGAVTKAYAIDETRVFVTGLSAGGAMTAVMLATYPELFAAGAILAGVPYGCADTVGEAFACMGGRGEASAEGLADKVRAASPHRGPWPRVQVWQGSADHTVVPSNADALALQWTGVHGLPASPSREDQVEGHPRRLWLDGAAVVEQISVTGMAHGVPLSGAGEDPIGQAGAHMLDVGLDSTARIAAFFGIAPEAEAAAGPRAASAEAKPVPQHASGPQAVIEKALKAAGLMR